MHWHYQGVNSRGVSLHDPRFLFITHHPLSAATIFSKSYLAYCELNSKVELQFTLQSKTTVKKIKFCTFDYTIKKKPNHHGKQNCIIPRDNIKID